MKKLFILLAAVAVSVFANAKDEVIITEGNVKFMQEPGKTAIVEINFPNTQVVEFDGKKVKEDFGTIDQYLRAHNDDWTATMVAEGAAGMDVDIVAQRKQMMASYNGMTFNRENKKGMKFLASETMQNTAAYYDAKQKAKMEKYGMVYGDRANADYKFVLTIDTIDMGSNSGAALNIAFGAFAKEAGGAIVVGSMEAIDMKTNEVIAKFRLNQVKGDSGMTPDARMQLVLDEIFAKELLPISKKKK